MAIHESIETILLKRNRKAWRKDFGPKKFDSMLSESETEDKQRALRSGSYKPGDEAPKVSTQSDTVRPWDVAQTENTFYTGSQNSGIMGQNDNSDPYAIQETRQKPYTNPDDIPRGYNPNDYVYKSTQQAPTNDPHGKTWTLEEQKKKQLNDLTIERSNLEASFVGMPTTEVVVKLGAFDDEIAQLSQELGVDDSASVPTMTAPIPEHSLPAPKVPTMMEPIQRFGQPNEPLGQTFTGDVVDQAGAGALGDDFMDDVVGHVGDTEDGHESEHGSGGAGGGGGAGGSWGDEEEMDSTDRVRLEETKAFADTFMGTADGRPLSSTQSITIDFTLPEYEQARELYAYLEDGNTVAQDLARIIMKEAPIIAEKWGYDRLVNEIDAHYKLYRLGINTDRTEECNISIDGDTSWELISGLTNFANTFGDNLQLPK